jgi:hypothetical protein
MVEVAVLAQAIYDKLEAAAREIDPHHTGNEDAGVTLIRDAQATAWRLVEEHTPQLMVVAPEQSPVEQVFDAWRASTGKKKARLDNVRRRRIEIALRGFPLGDVLEAVQGWKASPWHRGENDTGTVYNDLGLLLRNAEKIEMFRDAHRNGGSGVDRAAQIAAMIEDGQNNGRELAPRRQRQIGRG